MPVNSSITQQTHLNLTTRLYPPTRLKRLFHFTPFMHQLGALNVIRPRMLFTWNDRGGLLGRAARVVKLEEHKSDAKSEQADA